MVHVKYPLFVIIFKINFYYITYHRLYLISIYYMLLNKLKKKSVNCCSNIILFLYIRFFFSQKVQLDDQRSITILFVKYLIKS